MGHFERDREGVNNDDAKTRKTDSGSESVVASNDITLSWMPSFASASLATHRWMRL